MITSIDNDKLTVNWFYPSWKSPKMTQLNFPTKIMFSHLLIWRIFFFFEFSGSLYHVTLNTKPKMDLWFHLISSWNLWEKSSITALTNFQMVISVFTLPERLLYATKLDKLLRTIEMKMEIVNLSTWKTSMMWLFVCPDHCQKAYKSDFTLQL